MLVAQNPGVFDANPELPAREPALPGERRLPRATRTGAVGRQTLERGRATRASCSSRACSTGPDGKPLAAPPDYATLFTNDFLP